MKITVNKDNVKIEEFDIVHEGEHRVNKCSFSFSEEYTEELVKKVIFTSQNSSVEVAIINNECNIPTEILKARNIVLLGVYAYKVVDDKLDLRYSPSPDAFKVNSGSYIEGASKSEEITPSQFEQYMQALNDGLNKVEESIKKMDEATSSATQLVDDINQKLENGDFIGPQGVPGNDGVGITTITSGQSIVEEDKTITPVTVQKSDGSSQSFKVEAKNGIDGQNGQNGKDGVNGQNGQDGTTPNIQIGTVETLEPNEHATVTRTGTDEEPLFNFGIPKGQQGEQGIQGIPGQDGQPGADGQPGQDGADGKDATINGQNTVEITTDNNIALEQQESVLKLGLNSQLIPKQDVEGTYNTFDDGLKSPLYALGGDGKSEQVVTQGYNLIGVNDVEETTKNGLTYSVKNGLLKLNGTATALVPLGNILFNIPAEAGKYRFEIFPQNGTWKSGWLGVRGYVDGTQKWYQQIAKTNNTNYVINDRTVEELDGCNRCDVYVSSGSTFDNFRCYVQLKKGTEHSLYEPYTGGQPSPSPDYPQPINSIEGSLEFACRGKNLLNATREEYSVNGLTVSFDNSNMCINGVATQNSKYIGTTYKLGKGTYTLSLNILRGNIASSDTGAIFYLYEGTSYTILNKAIILKTNTKGYSTFTLEKETNVSLGLFARTTETFNNVVLQYQVTKGENPDYNFEPYVQPNEVIFNLGQEKLRSVGDVKDELVVDLDTGDYYKVENVGEIIFDGSYDETIVKRSDVTIPNASCFCIENFDYTLIRDLIGMCNYFRYDTEKRNIKDTFRFIKSPGYAIQFCIEDNFASNSDEFRTWLSTHNTIVDYILQTPTTKKLGTLSAEDLAKLKTFKGYNNVTVNTNLGLMNIRFTYGLDIKKYVDNKIAEISTALIEEG